MGNNGVKGIVLIALLVIVSLIIGSQISDNRVVSVGIVAAMVGAFVLLYMGKNSWWLMFFAPPVASLLRMPIPPSLSRSLIIVPAIFAYWLVMWIMGYVKIKWHSLWFTDLMLLLMFLYACISFYRHPVAFSVLELGIDEVGGKEYVICLLGVISYIAISCLPITFEQTKKLIKFLFFLSVGIACLQLLLTLGTGHGAGDGDEEAVVDTMEAATTTRFTLLSPLGSILAVYLYASTPFIRLFTKPTRILGLLMGVAAVVLGGWRGRFIEFCCRFVFIALLKRELSIMLIMAALAYGGLQLLGQEGVLSELPYGMQRALCAIPDLQVDPKIRQDTNASSRWRVVMWKWALDPKTGYIRDYVWGDGFAQSLAVIKRERTASMRGTLRRGDQRTFAAHGVWHSGWITTMHRLGIIGLVIVVIWQLQTIYIVMALGRVYKKISAFYFAAYCCQHISKCSLPIQYHLSAGTLPNIYNAIFGIACVKLFYCCARDKGLITPFIRTAPYIPLAIQAHQQTAPVPFGK